MYITERRAKQDMIDKCLHQYWGDDPRVDTSHFPGEEVRDKVNAFVSHIVNKAHEDGVELKPADVARRAADHIVSGRPTQHVDWRTLDDYGRDLEYERHTKDR